jgi:transposase
MPQVEDIIRLENIHVLDVQERGQGSRLKVCAEFSGTKRCPHCISRQLRSKGSYFRKLKHTRQGNVLIELSVKVFKLRCKKCHKYFVTSLPGVLSRRRATENFRLEVFEDHFGGHTGLDVAQKSGLSCSTVERWFKEFLTHRYRETLSRRRHCPRVLGIDEHFFTRKKGYATTLVDLAGRYVFDVRLGRSRQALRGYLKQLPGRDRVRVVVMDLSQTYRSIVEEFFPNAMIVADRFHVVRLVQHHFQKVWARLDEAGRKNRGLLSLFRRKRCNMSSEQHSRLESYLESVPGLKSVDEFQQRLLKYLRIKGIGPMEAKKYIPELLSMIGDLKISGFASLQTLGATLEQWLEPIARMWRFSKSNSITEGFHNKMGFIPVRGG